MASDLCSSSRVNSQGSLLMDQSQSTTSSTTLADLPITEDLTLLKRRELELGRVLGRGRYSEVHSITKIHLKSNTNADDTNNNDNTTITNPYKKKKKSLKPEGRYVMKHIQNKLFANRSHRRFARDLTNAIADLVTEAMYLSKLRHPHIIVLRGLTRGGTSVLKRSNAVAEDYFLLLDRMEETLDQRIHQRWKRTITTTRRQDAALVATKTRYAWQMASALTYLHDHQILYRDFKPENIGFVLQDSSLPLDDPNRDRLQLFDFGLARELDEPPPVEEGQAEKLYSLSASGTRRYMAPEIFNGKGKYNYKADTYSWAIVYFECLSHVKPFADFTTQSHEELVCRLGGRPKLAEIQWPEELCEDRVIQQVESLLQDAWHQDLHQRPSMAQTLRRVEQLLLCMGVEAAGEETSTSEDVFSTLQVQQHFFANDPTAVVFLQKKISTSELTVATDPMASDSEIDAEGDEDHPKGRWSHSSGRSSISSLGSMPRH